METPDRIKKSLRIHSLPHPSGCIGCAYRGGNETKIPNGCADKLFKDVREYIKQLEARVPRWISVEERLPENEKPVLVSAKRKYWDGREYSVVFTAFHTDGTTHTEDSCCGWNPEDTGLKYCEETDDYIVPEAWWEDVRYGDEFSKVYDTTVTHWMHLPTAPEEDTK